MFFINESDRACHWSCIIRITCRCMSFSEETRERERGGGNIWGRMALTASDMERLFSLLLSPDTEVIKQVPHTPKIHHFWLVFSFRPQLSLGQCTRTPPSWAFYVTLCSTVKILTWVKGSCLHCVCVCVCVCHLVAIDTSVISCCSS